LFTDQLTFRGEKVAAGSTALIFSQTVYILLRIAKGADFRAAPDV
jgi:hypothetical protein